MSQPQATEDDASECGFCEGGITGRYVGEGQFDEFDCPYCDGTGKVRA